MSNKFSDKCLNQLGVARTPCVLGLPFSMLFAPCNYLLVLKSNRKCLRRYVLTCVTIAGAHVRLRLKPDTRHNALADTGTPGAQSRAFGRRTVLVSRDIRARLARPCFSTIAGPRNVRSLQASPCHPPRRCSPGSCTAGSRSATRRRTRRGPAAAAGMRTWAVGHAAPQRQAMAAAHWDRRAAGAKFKLTVQMEYTRRALDRGWACAQDRAGQGMALGLLMATILELRQQMGLVVRVWRTQDAWRRPCRAGVAACRLV